MPNTLALQTTPRPVGTRRNLLVPWAALAGLLLTTGIAVTAAFAGVIQHVDLPHWWGPWPVRRQGGHNWFLVAELLLLGTLCVLWTWLAAALMRPPQAQGPDTDPVLRGRPRAGAIVGTAALWALPLTAGGPIGSLDVQSYAAIGRLAAIGLDPYQATTGLLGDRFGAAVDPLWRWSPTPYGPVQVQLLRGVALMTGAHVGAVVLLIRVVAVLGLAAALVLAVRASRASDWVAVLVVTALNPVVLIHVVSGAHLDVLIGALAVAVVVLARRGHHGAAMTLAVLACGLKLPGVVLVAFVLLDVLRRTAGATRRRALLSAVACGGGAVGAIVVLCPDPFGWIPALSVPGTVHNGAAPSTWLAYAAGLLTGRRTGPGLDFSFTVGRMAMGLLGVGVVVALLIGATSGSAQRAFRGVGWALVVVAVTGPALYPWYLTWGLFAAAIGSGPRGRLALVGLGSATCLAAALGQGWLVLVAWLVVMLSVLGFTGWIALPHLTGRAARSAPVDSQTPVARASR